MHSVSPASLETNKGATEGEPAGKSAPSPTPLGGPPENWEELSEDDFVREFSFDFSDDLEYSDKKGPPSGRKSTLGHQTGGAIEKKAQIQAPPQYLESDSEKCPPQGGLNLEDLPLSNTHQTLQAPGHIP